MILENPITGVFHPVKFGIFYHAVKLKTNKIREKENTFNIAFEMKEKTRNQYAWHRADTHTLNRDPKNDHNRERSQALV